MRRPKLRRLALFAGVGLFLPTLLISTCAVIAGMEKTVFEVASPDGRYVAWVTVQDSWGGDSTGVLVRDLREVDASGRPDTKRLLQMIGRAPIGSSLTLTWQDGTTLVLEHFRGAKIYSIRDEPWHDLKFVVRERERTPASRS